MTTKSGRSQYAFGGVAKLDHWNQYENSAAVATFQPTEGSTETVSGKIMQNEQFNMKHKDGTLRTSLKKSFNNFSAN